MNVTELKNELRSMHADASKRRLEIIQCVGVGDNQRRVGFSISEDGQRVEVVAGSTAPFPNGMQPALDEIVRELNDDGGIELTTAVEPGLIHCLGDVEFTEFMSATDSQIIGLFLIALPARVIEAMTLAEAVQTGKTVADVLDHRRRAIEKALANTRIEVDFEDDES